MESLKIRSKEKSKYSKFSKLDGGHPLQKSCPDSFITYNVRRRHGGRVAFFNFDLAKEMGLISIDHPSRLNKKLEKQILDSFSLVIINEYDIENEIEFPKEDILPNKYMATRYLQLQHPNKQGKTSGDGRSIWNGVIKHRGKTWDVSSQGTGATKLSPATHIQNKFFQTGDPSISYGCGYSEVDEGLATLMFSEVMKKNNFETERCLAIIQFDNNLSINIRANHNLVRPSHMFNHLKQSNYEALSDIVNYYIDRQVSNSDWSDIPKSKTKRYDYLLKRQTEIFARLAADFEDEYIFCWLDWDGDNILMNGGIIDYGSIRQFGLYHHEYRYDDVQRYSTSIKEQKDKARYIVQSMAQIVDFLITGNKKGISDFSQCEAVEYFDAEFEKRKKKNLLTKIGFSNEQVNYLYQYQNQLVESFQKDFYYFERAKSEVGLYEVSDGVCWDAIFCMRDILREYPQLLLSRQESIDRDEFIKVIKSSYATKSDLELTSYRAAKIDSFQENYQMLINTVSKKMKVEKNEVLLSVLMRSSIINKYERVTGDSISKIIEVMMKEFSTFDAQTLFRTMSDFRDHQTFDPDKVIPKNIGTRSKREKKPIMNEFLKIVRDYREGI